MRLYSTQLATFALVVAAVTAVLSGRSQTMTYQAATSEPGASEPGTWQAARPEVSTDAKAENARGDRLAKGTVFRTSDRCVACHNGMKTPDGEEISLGLEWQASIMANASRDPYWQASIRRETMDHPGAKEHVENDCSTCHMPVVRMADRDRGVSTDVFAKFPLDHFPRGDRAAADGVTCSVCHQIDAADLGAPASFSGKVQFSKPISRYLRAEYGPFDVTPAHQTIMHSSTATYGPTRGDHIREAALCGSCHTLITDALGPDGKETGIKFPEQMPYQEWQHSAYNDTKQTCQECHMPEVRQPVPITALYGQPREGVHRHVFVGPNFLMEGMLQDHRDALATVAPVSDLDAMIGRTTDFLETKAAKVQITPVTSSSSALAFDVHVENLGGHKLPSAYPSRRAWLHVVVKDAAGETVFESGKLNPDGSIVGNLNDENPALFEPHFTTITHQRQVEIYEDIIQDATGHVTTGLFAAVSYLKDNRLLPRGFDKDTAPKEIAVVGGAATDPKFNDRGSTVRYVVRTGNARGPLTVTAELWFQPIGFRWAHNLEPYKAPEPQRMVEYFDQASAKSAMLIASAQSTR
ncbi:MAG: cytochrome c family protein [Acidobacteriota bacterium]|nr:cytochrome c family protein [Acidobacteriota bacterium]